MPESVIGRRPTACEVNRQQARAFVLGLRLLLLDLRARGHTFARIAEMVAVQIRLKPIAALAAAIRGGTLIALLTGPRHS